MLKIAVLADIHGNMPALEAVLADIEAAAPDEVIVGGDLVGRGPDGRAVVARIAGLGWRCVRGNHEDYLLNFRRRQVPDTWWGAPEWSASQWMAAELDDAAVAYIDALPFSCCSSLAPELCVYHGSPRSHSEGLGSWSSDALLDEHLERATGNILVCAHTHRSMERIRPTGRVVNVGSVGLPFNGDVRAQYAIFERDAQGAWQVDFRRVMYDRAATQARYRESGFLAEGGITAQLLALELEHARSFLVPFLKWAEYTSRLPRTEHLPAFLDFYDPEAPLQTLFEQLQALAAAGTQEEGM